MVFNVVNSTPALAHADMTGIAVVGGHFSWNVWQELPSYQMAHGNKNIAMGNGGGSRVADSCIVSNTDRQSDQLNQSNRSSLPSEMTVNPSPIPNPSLGTSAGSISNPGPISTPGPGLQAVPPCFVAMRHPVARAKAFYYQRCYDTYGCDGYQRYMNDLSVEELSFILANYRNVGTDESTKTAMILDDGMNDASCRALQSIEPTMRGMPIHNTQYQQHTPSTHPINTP